MGICAIWGTPRSGKTTLALNLAYAVSRGDKSVCLISPMPYSELYALLGINIPKERSLQAALKGEAGIRQTVFQVDELFYILAAPTAADAFDSDYSGEQVKALLDFAKIAFDVVIIDCPSETNNLIAAWSLNRADTVLLCLGGHISCPVWYTANKRALQALSGRVVHISSEVTSDFDYNAMFRLLSCTPDVRIPYVREAPLLTNESRFLYDMLGKKGQSYAQAINKLYEVITL